MNGHPSTGCVLLFPATRNSNCQPVDVAGWAGLERRQGIPVRRRLLYLSRRPAEMWRLAGNVPRDSVGACPDNRLSKHRRFNGCG